MTPTIGRIVHYHFTEANVRHLMDEHGIKHVAGDIAPMIVTMVRLNGGTDIRVNGQVFCDGPEVLWAVSVKRGGEPGQWSWPPKV